MKNPILSGIREDAQKKAAVSFNTLKAIAKGNKPLFHMVRGSNAPGFLKNLKIMTPAEAKLRRLLTVSKHPAVTGEQLKAVSLARGKARINIKNAIRGMIEDYGHKASTSIARDYSKASLPGVTGATARRKFLRRFRPGEGQFWDTIHMSKGKPLQGRYGNIGVMAGVDDIKYPLQTISPKGSPFFEKNIEQYLVKGKSIYKGGLLSGIELPTVKGTIVYNPKYVMDNFGIEVARKLKSQGAIPLNARFYRRLKALNKQLPTYVPPNAREEAIRGADLFENFPNYKTILSKAQRYVNSI